MKRIAAVAVVAIVLLGGCPSAPETVNPPDELYDQAKELRSTIVEFDLAQYSPDVFEAGETAFSIGESAYEGGDYAAAESELAVAVDQYRIVVADGFKAVSTARKGEADAEKARADGIRAAVAVPESYQSALDIYNQALAAQDDGEDETAAELFENATTLFQQAYEAAAEKKRRAEEALSNIGNTLDTLDQHRTDLEQRAADELPDDEEDN
jgi:tetratricopeptide (TPR) repeat protein